MKYNSVPQTYGAFEALLQCCQSVNNRKKREGTRDESKGKNGSNLSETKDASITVKNFAFISERKIPGIYLDTQQTLKGTLFSRTGHFCEINTDTTEAMGFGGNSLSVRLRHRPPGGSSVHDGVPTTAGGHRPLICTPLPQHLQNLRDYHRCSQRPLSRRGVPGPAVHARSQTLTRGRLLIPEKEGGEGGEGEDWIDAAFSASLRLGQAQKGRCTRQCSGLPESALTRMTGPGSGVGKRQVFRLKDVFHTF